MKRILIFLLVLGLASTTTEAQGLKGFLKKAEKAISGDSDDGSIGSGIKQALEKGAGEASDFLSAEDGYYKTAYKILLPKEAQKVAKKLKAVPGFANVEDDLIEKFNRAAEDAAVKAKPIFVSAIKQMTIKDAMNLLMGEQDAATRYLEKTTYNQLYDEFRPIVIASLDKVNARTYWSSAVGAYNKIPFQKKVNPELDDYVTQKALVGLFSLVEKKEKDIRENPAARTTDLLKKVFSRQDK